MLAGPKTKCFCGNIKIKLSFWPQLTFYTHVLVSPKFLLQRQLDFPRFICQTSVSTTARYFQQRCSSAVFLGYFCLQRMSQRKAGGKGRTYHLHGVFRHSLSYIFHPRAFSGLDSSADPERFDVSSRNSPGSFQCERKLPPSSALIGYSSLQSERNAEQAQQPQEGGFNSVYRQPIGSLLHKIENIQFNRNLNPLCVCTTNSTTARQSSANEQLKHLNADHFCLCSSFSISVAFETFEWETVNITTQTLFCFHNRCCSC